MSTIGELVRLDPDAQFRSDVQLDAYDKPHNLGLLKSYLFTSQAPTGYESSIDILKTILQAFTSNRLDNRMTVIANYGHGKSHLALALANYFGRPVNSEECQVLLSKVAAAVPNQAVAATYKAFKVANPRHLILRLRGDSLGESGANL